MKNFAVRFRCRVRILVLGLCLCGWIVYSSTSASLAHRADDNIEVHGHVALSGGRNGRWAAVWLEGTAHGAPLSFAQIDQREKTFLPHVLIVTPGTKVTFPNNDTVFHNVFAYFEAKRFDLGMYPRGASRTEKFDKPGIVSVLCNVHPQMSAYIVIVDTPYFATAATNGDFVIKDVHPGNYVLHAWHESGERLTKPITIAPGANPMTLSLEKR